MSKHRNPDRGKNRGRRDGRGRGDDRGGLQVLPGGPDGDGLLVAEGVEADVVALRADARALAAAEARRLRRAVAIAERCTRETRAFLALGGRVPGATSDTELVMSAVTCELMMALGISKSHAEGLQMLATRLVRVLPETLAMLEMGRLDLTRARLLAEATEILDDDHAREVQAPLLPALGAGPWDGPSPRAWRARVQRAVITVDPDSARRRRETAIRDRLVRAWAVGDGTGVIQIVGRDVDIAAADRVITDLAHAWPAVGPDGEALSMDQRRADAVMDLFRRVADGNDLPWMRTGREREVAIVIHADTFFGNGPGKDAPGEVRGLDARPHRPNLGRPAGPHPDPSRHPSQGAAGGPRGCPATHHPPPRGSAGRLDPPPPRGIRAQGDPRLASAADRELRTDGRDHRPCASRAPRCTSYDCARLASHCDLDHDQAYPRGPTCVTNLCPRCRRHHELKTRGLVQTRLRQDGSITTTTLLGTTVTTRPERLPGHGPGEAYATLHTA
ncbi:MAG: DUF222 domain-containing protein [Sporichthyaceae bacterium]